MKAFYFVTFALILNFANGNDRTLLDPVAGTCSGANSGLSITRNKMKNYNKMLTRYRNCTTVIGNLEITGLHGNHNSSGELDIDFLNNIQVVTGYVAIAYNYITSISLNSLRLIRGRELYKGKYALYIFHNYNHKNKSQYLERLSLSSLVEIVEGGVFISGNHLCYLDTINWSDIFNMPYHREANWTATITNTLPATCQPCHPSCNRKCWGEGPSMCQNYTQINCHPVCGGTRCRGPESTQCCNRECAAGCTGPTDRDCMDCLHVNNDGICQSDCPRALTYDSPSQRHIKNPGRKYHYLYHCVSKCPDNLFVEHNGCVKSCRAGYHNNGTGECVECPGGVCERECYGVSHDDGPLSNNVSVTSKNIHHFEGCNVIRGNLVFLSHAFETDHLHSTPPISEAQLYSAFHNIKKITGHLRIVSWPENLTDFSIFQNLEEIGGSDLYRDLVALSIYGRFDVMSMGQITSLGLQSLKRVLHGNVYLGYLHNLCYGRTINWSMIVKNPKEYQNFEHGAWIRGNKIDCDQTHCDSLCDDNGCWGPGPHQCLQCAKGMFTFNGTCYKECRKDLSIYEVPGDHVCKPCHPQCSTCERPGPDNCDTCRNYRDLGRCVERCPIDKYVDSFTKQCLPCSEYCTKTKYSPACSGPNAILGKGGCNFCHYVMATQTLQVVSCLPFNSTCPPGHFKIDNIASAQHACIPCYEGCRSCDGMKKDDCHHAIPLSGRLLALAICLPLSAFLMFVLLFVAIFLRHKRELKKRKQRESMRALGFDTTPELNSDPTTRLMEPLTPSGVAPNQAQLRIVKEGELERTKILGSGAFGTVYKGYWTPEVAPKAKVKVPVAIKVLRDDSSQVASSELLDEAFLMASCEHPNLVRLLGISLSPKILLITQLMPLGNLLEYVRNNKDNIGSQHLLNWSLQITKGMRYLGEEKHLVHRDLAARNVLVKSPHHVRITDFGLAKLLDVKEGAYRAEGEKMPIKWLALESIQKRIFTQKSDVWSFGVTMWELMTFGKKPYDNVPARNVLALLERGERLSQPRICTIDIYMLLIKCWTVDVEARPTFRELSEELSRMARDPSRYIVIDNEELRGELPDPPCSEILDRLRSEMDDGTGECQIADADDYFPHQTTITTANGFSLQPVPATVPWKHQQDAFSPALSETTDNGARANELFHNLTTHNGHAQPYLSRHQSSNDSPKTANFSDTFEVFNPPTPTKSRDVIELEDCSHIDNQAHAVRAREDSTTLRYSADPVSLLREENGFQPGSDPYNYPASTLFLKSSEGFFDHPLASALANPEYEAPFGMTGTFVALQDSDGYELPISCSKSSDYANMPSPASASSSQRLGSDESQSSGRAGSDSGLPSDDDEAKRKTSVVNPNYEWLESDADGCQYENLGHVADAARIKYGDDEIFNKVAKAKDECFQDQVMERTYSEPDSGVGVEIGVDNILYHKIGAARNV